MKNCTKCGKELRENDAYCPACGLSTDGLDREEGKSKNWFALIGFIFSLCDCIPGLALDDFQFCFHVSADNTRNYSVQQGAEEFYGYRIATMQKLSKL